MMIIRSMLLLASLGLVIISCIGGAPRQHFLSLSDTGAAICEGGEQGSAAPRFVIAVKDFESLPSLDRTSVLIASGRVLTPSHSWYWEGPPAEILTMAAAGGISNSMTIASAWPYRPRVERDGLISGRVLAFAAELSEPARFRAAVRVELWDGRGGEKLAENVFEVERELPGFGPAKLGDPDVLARAAGGAVCGLGEKIRTWLESNMNLLKKE